MSVPGAARRLVSFLLRQKSHQKRRTRRTAFCFCFFVADISAVNRAARKLALTFISNLHHRVAHTGSRRRPPIHNKNISGAEGWATLSLRMNIV
jgi:hypothetical protein